MRWPTIVSDGPHRTQPAGARRRCGAIAQAQQFGDVALLHDGRAGSIEQAILWHGGTGGKARSAHSSGSIAAERALLLRWVASL
ncbi:MAG: di-heme oxidoredictase family protein [Pseudomonadota bacterium]